MRRLLTFFAIICLSDAIFVRIRRETDDAPFARGMRHFDSEIRRKPPVILEAIGPIAFGKRTGDDLKVPVHMVGDFGAGNVKTNVVKFIPEGSESEIANGGTYDVDDHPNLGYMNRETAAGKTTGSRTKMSMLGLGRLETNDEREQGTGLLDFSKALFPFLELPALKTDRVENPNTDVDPALAKTFYSHPSPRVPSKSSLYELETLETTPSTPFHDIKFDKSADPFSLIKKRPGYRVHAAKTMTEDADLLGDEEGFIPQGENDEDISIEDEEVDKPSSPFTKKVSTINTKNIQLPGTRIPISKLGLSKAQIYQLCARFAPVAAKYCYGPKIPQEFIAKCQGYNADCQEFQAEAKPLGAIANAFSSGVGLTYYDWGVNGIPYYPVNEEGGVGNGHHGKVDFGTWGGGYSDNVGIRDYYSQTGEFGANWYEGTYGYKTGWSVPIAQSLGVEGGQGTSVHVPLKEDEVGQPISITNGYHVGPYIGLADRVGIDWYNGGVSFNKGFAVPFIGVGVNSGTSVGFPSVGHIMQRMGLNGVDYLKQMAAAANAATTFEAPGMSASSSSSVITNGGDGSSVSKFY